MKKKATTLFSSFVKLLTHSKKTLLLIIIVAAITLVLSAFISIMLERISNLRFPAIGNIRAIGVEASVSYIDWGTVYPGMQTNRTFYIQSISNVKTTLNLNTTSWNPPDIAGYMNLSWNYSGAQISPGEVIPLTFTLSVSNSPSLVNYLITNDVKDFSFDIIIRAEEY